MSLDVEEFFAWVMDHNLNDIIRFHGHMRSGLHEIYRQNEGDRYAEITVFRYDDYLATATFLMIYAFLEEYLYLAWKRHARDRKRSRAFSIKRYAPMLRALGVSTDDPNWTFLEAATDIRHCILHANGRISLMSSPSPSQIIGIVAAHPIGLATENDRLILKVNYLEQFVREVRVLQSSVAEALKKRSSANT